jgi:hypothetical protein
LGGKIDRAKQYLQVLEYNDVHYHLTVLNEEGRKKRGLPPSLKQLWRDKSVFAAPRGDKSAVAWLWRDKMARVL